MRILFFTFSFAPHTETFVYSDIIGMAARHEVKVVCLQRENEDKFPFDGSLSVIPYQLPWLKKKLNNRLFSWNISLNYYHRSFSRQLNQVVHQFKPDIIHCYFGPAATMLHDNLEDEKLPIVANFLGYDASHWLQQYPAYAKKLMLLFKSPRIFPTANADALFQYLARRDISSAQSRRIFLGIDPDIFRPTSAPPAPFTFLQVASLRPKKGHQFTLEAFRAFLQQVAQPENYRMALVGDGPLKLQLMTQCQRAGISAFVEFAGWATPKEVQQYLAASHCFWHTSITAENGDTEGIPTAIKEAMSMELPVVATYHAGIPELVQHSVNGLLVEEKNIAQYVAAMHEIVSWGRQPQNRRRIIHHFSINRRLRELEDYYRYALAQSTQNH